MVYGGDRAFYAASPKEWNKLPEFMHSAELIPVFKTADTSNALSVTLRRVISLINWLAQNGFICALAYLVYIASHQALLLYQCNK